MERTFGIIKPNATAKNVIGKIVTMMEDSDLRIVGMRYEQLTKEKAQEFYAEHSERPFFGSLVEFMTSGPVVVLALEGEDAVSKYRNLMGATNSDEAAPGTIRKTFGEGIEKNAVHGSDSTSSAERELKFFFG